MSWKTLLNHMMKNPSSIIRAILYFSKNEKIKL